MFHRIKLKHSNLMPLGNYQMKSLDNIFMADLSFHSNGIIRSYFNGKSATVFPLTPWDHFINHFPLDPSNHRPLEPSIYLGPLNPFFSLSLPPSFPLKKQKSLTVRVILHAKLFFIDQQADGLLSAYHEPFIINHQGTVVVVDTTNNIGAFGGAPGTLNGCG